MKNKHYYTVFQINPTQELKDLIKLTSNYEHNAVEANTCYFKTCHVFFI